MAVNGLNGSLPLARDDSPIVHGMDSPAGFQPQDPQTSFFEMGFARLLPRPTSPPSLVALDPDEGLMDQVLALIARKEIEEFGLVPLDQVEIDYSKNLGTGLGWQNWGFGSSNNGVYRVKIEGVDRPLVVKLIDNMGEDTVREIRNYALFSLLEMGPRFYGVARFPDRDSIGIFMAEIPNGLNTKDIYNFGDIREPIGRRMNHRTLQDLLRARRYFDRFDIWTQDLDFLILPDGHLVLIDPADFEFFIDHPIRPSVRSVDNDHLDFALFYWMKHHIIAPRFLPPGEMNRVAAYLRANAAYIERYYGPVAGVIENLRQEGYPFPPDATLPSIHSMTDRELEEIVSRVMNQSTARIALQRTPIPAYLEQIWRHPIHVEEIPVSSEKELKEHVIPFPFTVEGIIALERKLRDHIQFALLLSSPGSALQDRVKLASLHSVVLIEGEGGKVDGIGLVTNDPKAEGYIDVIANPDGRATELVQKTMHELNLWDARGKNPFFWKEEGDGTISLLLQPLDGDIWIMHLWFLGLLEAADGNHVFPPMLAAVKNLFDQQRNNYPSAAGHPAKQRDLMRFEDANKAREWLAAMQDKKSLPAHEGNSHPFPIPFYNIGELHQVTIDGKEYLFRPFKGDRDDISTFRRMLAVSQLKELMGVETVPSSWMARLNGKMGLISPFPYHEYFDEGKVKPDSLAEAFAFQFLIGNWMGWTDFVRLDAEGRLMTFDNSYAFALGLVGKTLHDDSDSPARRPFGVHLPERYPPSFVHAIQHLAPDIVSDTLKGNLTDYEMNDLLFRREVILRDIEMRAVEREETELEGKALAASVSVLEEDSWEAVRVESAGGGGGTVCEVTVDEESSGRSFLVNGGLVYGMPTHFGRTMAARRAVSLRALVR